MKKLSLIILTLVLSLGLKAQNPSVAITINNTTPFEVNASFVKNADCQRYTILIGTEAEMQVFVAMFGVPIETLVATWGITYSADSNHTWTEMTPNTEYNVYALAIGATDSALSQTTATTLPLGSTGISSISIDLSEITSTSVRMTCTPDTNTAVFYDGIVRKSFADSLGVDSTVALMVEAGSFYPQYTTDDWVWQDLESNTEFYAVAIGKNSLDEWGDTTIVSFATLDPLSLEEEVNIEDIVEVYPNPSKGEFSYKVNSDFDNLYIYDIKGTLVHKQSLIQRQDNVNVSNLKEGVYFVRFFKKGQAGKTVKIIIEK
ncbi:MAG: T9SS type A sorting domain-containing protein [Bacteroidales bacterium]|nr:T9SS type A sorting domain-containing protein [Bacteroidales bacterium]